MKKPLTKRAQLVAALTAATSREEAKTAALALLKEREREGLDRDALPTKLQFDTFFEKVNVQSTGCWIWSTLPGRRTKDGLPLFGDCPDNAKHDKEKPTDPDRFYGARLKTKTPTAHRTAFSWFRGLLLPYPHWKLTQTCGDKGCVQPAHLRQVRVPDRKEIKISTDHLKQVFSHIEVAPHLEGNCWMWTGQVNAGGYATASFDGQPLQSVDLLTFGWFVGYGPGQSPVTHQIYHRCLRRGCINPAHFDLVDFGTRTEKMKAAAKALLPAGETNAESEPTAPSTDRPASPVRKKSRHQRRRVARTHQAGAANDRRRSR